MTGTMRNIDKMLSDNEELFTGLLTDDELILLMRFMEVDEIVDLFTMLFREIMSKRIMELHHDLFE